MCSFPRSSMGLRRYLSLRPLRRRSCHRFQQGVRFHTCSNHIINHRDALGLPHLVVLSGTSLIASACLWTSSRGYYYNCLPQPTTTACLSSSSSPRKQPVQFGTSLPPRWFSSSSSFPNDNAADNSNDDKYGDCPICQKYSRGPCGDLFTKWLACTDAHPGTDPNTGKEVHVERCLVQAQALAECLQTNESYYGGNIDTEIKEASRETDSSPDQNDLHALQEAWQEVIQEVEQRQDDDSSSHGIPQRPFPPHLVPILEIRPSTRTGMAAFVLELHSNITTERLVLCYVKSGKNGRLVAAGGRDDLWEWQPPQQQQGDDMTATVRTYGVLQLSSLLQKDETDASTVTAYALYSSHSSKDKGNDDEEVLYTYTVRLPPPLPKD